MPLHNYFVKENARRAEIDEFLSQELKRAGYSKVEMNKTPLGTRIVVYGETGSRDREARPEYPGPNRGP